MDYYELWADISKLRLNQKQSPVQGSVKVLKNFSQFTEFPF